MLSNFAKADRLFFRKPFPVGIAIGLVAGLFAGVALQILAPKSLSATPISTKPVARSQRAEHLPEAPRERSWTNLRRARLAGPYSVQVLRVVDGDTFLARIRVWLGQDVLTHVRLRGIDTPELNGRCAAEVLMAREARQALADILASGTLTLRDIGIGKYAGRVIARVHVTSGRRNVKDEAGAMLLAAGYARRYRSGRRGRWCNGSVNSR